MRGSRRRAAFALTVVSLAACSAEHSASRVASPFEPLPTVAPPDAEAEEAEGPHEPSPDDSVGGPEGSFATESTADSGAPATTAAPSTTTAPERWAAFDEALASRLIGSGDYAVGVAVAVDGEIVHTADLGFRVPPPTVPPPPSVPSSSAPDPSTTTTTTDGRRRRPPSRSSRAIASGSPASAR